MEFQGLEFNCASCGKKVLTEWEKANGRPDLRTRFCSAECERRYWRHPPQDRKSSRQTFQSLAQCEAWEKKTNFNLEKRRESRDAYITSQALPLYKRGMTDRQIGMQLGMSDTIIFTWRKRHGLPSQRQIKKDRKEAERCGNIT